MPVFFSKQLLRWHAAHPRPLPWDGGPRDPYHIWISEIIMQQTRLEQGAPYYKKFIRRFPDVHALAAASVDEVMRYWQGLGYYSRARNAHQAAEYIEKALNGKFPSSYDTLLQLPGIGPYSAAAIASFAYGLPYPVVDGNVKRLIARFSGMMGSVDEPDVHEQIRLVASAFMKDVPPGEFNQAIMNFGALVCKPKGALCETCVLSKKCFAFRQDMVDLLPVRTKKKTNTIRHLHFIVMHYRGKILLQRREGKDIWKGLYAPPVIERQSVRAPALSIIQSYVKSIIGHSNIALTTSSVVHRQLLSHQTIHGRFHHIRLISAPEKLDNPFVWVNNKTIHAYGRPRMVVQGLHHHDGWP